MIDSIVLQAIDVSLKAKFHVFFWAKNWYAFIFRETQNMDIYENLLMENLVNDYEDDDVAIFISCEDSENFLFQIFGELS